MAWRAENNPGEGARDPFDELVSNTGWNWTPETMELDRIQAAVAKVDKSLEPLGLDMQLRAHEKSSLSPDAIKDGYEYFIEAQDVRRWMVDCELSSEGEAEKAGINGLLRVALEGSNSIRRNSQKDTWIEIIDRFAPPTSVGRLLSENAKNTNKTRNTSEVFPRRIFYTMLLEAAQTYAESSQVFLPMRSVASAAYKASLDIDTLAPLDRPQLVSNFCRMTGVPQFYEMQLYDKFKWHFEDQESIRPLLPVA